MPVTQETRRVLGEFVPRAGHSTRNPLDVAPLLRNPDGFGKTLPAIMKDPNVDSFIVSVNVGWGGRTEDEDIQRRLLAHLSAYVHDNPSGKPILAVVDDMGRAPGMDERR